MVMFGVAGYYFMRKGGFPPAPLILAMILCPMLEKAMQLSLISSGGSAWTSLSISRSLPLYWPWRLFWS
jgi:putative tricarboxylic transport membrane protein